MRPEPPAGRAAGRRKSWREAEGPGLRPFYQEVPSGDGEAALHAMPRGALPRGLFLVPGDGMEVGCFA